ncbi:hypothetical protein R0381_000315 [Jeongeupia wiesaeckerbachi]|uniref:hypothetical protein n=1 Tax=Jeongeupia wiesaeckerbachi TaxID=3051218 RepID=UPI003D800549
MKIPANIQALKARVGAELADEIACQTPESSCLLLDSTGPSFTRQYIVLNAIGADRLARFGEIHAFSGSVYALFGFLAFSSGRNRVAIESLCNEDAEMVFRNQHHAGRFSGLRSMLRLIKGKSAFGTVSPLLASLEYIFGDFVEQPFSAFGNNIHIYLAKSKDAPLLVLSNNDNCSPELEPLRKRPIKHIIAMAANVPLVYGGKQDGAPYFDPVYTNHYLPTLKQITGTERRTLISTPWRSGQKENRRYLNCYPSGNANWLMLKDFIRLVAGLRNVSWSRDIYAAFKLQ